MSADPQLFDLDDEELTSPYPRQTPVHDRLPLPPREAPDEAAEVPDERPWPAARGVIDDLVAEVDASAVPRRGGRPGAFLRMFLEYLETQPGETWQERWAASGLEDDADWMQTAMTAMNAARGTNYDNGMTAGMVAWAAAVDAIRPSLEWMHRAHSELRSLPDCVLGHRDQAGRDLIVSTIAEHSPRDVVRVRHTTHANHQLARVLAHTGKHSIADVSPADLIDDRERARGRRKQIPTGAAYNAMSRAGLLHEDAPTRFINTRRTGQRSVEDLVDRTGIQNQRVRDFFVDYFRARSVGLDYSSLSGMIGFLVKNFWCEIESLRPGKETMEVEPALFEEWRDRIQIIRHGTHAGKPRKDTTVLLVHVRRLYFDINDWAQADPERYGDLATRNPVPAEATRARAKQMRRRRSESHERTRERLPLLPTLLAHVERGRRWASAVLEAVQDREPGDQFIVDGVPLEVPQSANVAFGGVHGAIKRGDGITVRRMDTGKVFDAVQLETVAFWRWAVLVTLTETGVRIEELEELTHASITQYRLQSTGELVPLLQIAPSKTDKERVLMMSMELTDAISAVIARVRDFADNGRIPLIRRWDYAEKEDSDLLPFLFQRSIDGRNTLVNRAWILRQMNKVAAEANLRDETGEVVHFQNHDFRRIFATEAAMSNLPVHILAKVLGHDDVRTTQGYTAIYPEEVFRRHRAFIERRRRERPSVEYREPTDQEWNEFLGHFVKRKVSLGTCGRAYGTTCSHEHACIRCSSLRPDPDEEPRFVDIIENLKERIVEAEAHGWFEELEGHKLSLAAAEDKLAKIRGRRSLGMPGIRVADEGAPA
ncbi:tyrosine-type recombinase/integrase [Curtobacterium flaccumfaciens]|uniref:tyrosine-type recombinase/integrase n=1 Tax=Curtobacterium flaccumfaciens TaxID=2035 RepID=UPI0013755F73|nr:site-specific integrase [Curtobacterium flaccumfaciens]